jgi:hypothetical protein
MLATTPTLPDLVLAISASAVLTALSVSDVPVSGFGAEDPSPHPETIPITSMTLDSRENFDIRINVDPSLVGS